MTTSPKSAWCQQEILSHIPLQPVRHRKQNKSSKRGGKCADLAELSTKVTAALHMRNLTCV